MTQVRRNEVILCVTRSSSGDKRRRASHSGVQIRRQMGIRLDVGDAIGGRRTEPVRGIREVDKGHMVHVNFAEI